NRGELSNLSYSPMAIGASYSYDVLGHLNTSYVYGSGFYENYSLGYSPRGDLTSWNASTPATGSVSLTATYDPVGRIASESHSNGTSFSYTYDAAGNRASKTGPSGLENYSYSNGHRLLSTGLFTQTWNTNGEVTQATRPGHTAIYSYRADATLA